MWNFHKSRELFYLNLSMIKSDYQKKMFLNLQKFTTFIVDNWMTKNYFIHIYFIMGLMIDP